MDSGLNVWRGSVTMKEYQCFLTYRLIIYIAVNVSIVMLILLETHKKQWKSHHYSSVLIKKDQKSLVFRTFRSQNSNDILLIINVFPPFRHREKCKLSLQAQMCTWLKFQIQHTLTYYGGHVCCTLAWMNLESRVSFSKSQKAFLKAHPGTLPHHHWHIQSMHWFERKQRLQTKKLKKDTITHTCNLFPSVMLPVLVWP